MRHGENSSAVEEGGASQRLRQRWRDWLSRRRARRNQQLLDAGRVSPDEPETEGGPPSPETDVFSRLGRNP
jgi:hypothetical protein